MGTEDQEDRNQANPEVLKEGLEEADKLLDYQIQWAMQSDEEVVSLMRLNLLVLGVLVSVIGVFAENFSQVVELDYIIIICLIASLIFWIFSFIVAIIAYKFNKIARGFEEWAGIEFESLDFNEIKDIPTTEDYFVGLLKDYDQVVKDNHQNLDCKYTLHIGAVWMMLISLLLFGLALGNSLSSSFFENIMIVTSLLVLVIGVVSAGILIKLINDFTAQTDRANRRAFLNPYDRDKQASSGENS